jgi:hypothetical protein
VAVVIAGGYLLDAFGIAVLAPAVLVLLVITAATTFALPRDRSMTRRAEQVSIGTVLRQPGVAALLAGFFLMQVAHGPYNTFFSIYLVDTGHSKKVVGWLWAIGVLAEIALFVWLPRLMNRMGRAVAFAAGGGPAHARDHLRCVPRGGRGGDAPDIQGPEPGARAGDLYQSRLRRRRHAGNTCLRLRLGAFRRCRDLQPCRAGCCSRAAGVPALFAAALSA